MTIYSLNLAFTVSIMPRLACVLATVYLPSTTVAALHQTGTIMDEHLSSYGFDEVEWGNLSQNVKLAVERLQQEKQRLEQAQDAMRESIQRLEADSGEFERRWKSEKQARCAVDRRLCSLEAQLERVEQESRQSNARLTNELKRTEQNMFDAQNRAKYLEATLKTEKLAYEQLKDQLHKHLSKVR